MLQLNTGIIELEQGSYEKKEEGWKITSSTRVDRNGCKGAAFTRTRKELRLHATDLMPSENGGRTEVSTSYEGPY